MPRRTIKHRTVLVTLLVAAVASLVAAVPAGAYLRDFQNTVLLTPNNSLNPKSQKVTCPGTKFPLGSGASIPLIGNLGIQRMYVLYGQRAVFDGAAETDAESGRWALANRAWCANVTAVKPNASGAPASYIKNVQYAANQSGTNSNFAKSAVATCPSGTSAIGGGGVIDGATSNVAFDSVQFLGNQSQLRVKAHEVDASSVNWSVEAHAVCADISNPSNTANYVDAISPPEQKTATNSVNKSLTVTCPAGKVIVGGGAEVYGAAPRENNASSKVVLKDSHYTGSPPNAWVGSAVETDPTAAAWTLEVRAVCAVRNAAPA
jgi:hypothetical protein